MMEPIVEYIVVFHRNENQQSKGYNSRYSGGKDCTAETFCDMKSLYSNKRMDTQGVSFGEALYYPGSGRPWQ